MFSCSADLQFKCIFKNNPNPELRLDPDPDPKTNKLIISDPQRWSAFQRISGDRHGIFFRSTVKSDFQTHLKASDGKISV
jgi:hypothetical protein